MLKVHPPKISCFSKRLSFNVSGEFQSGGVMAFAWFVFGNNVKGSTTVAGLRKERDAKSIYSTETDTE